MPWLLTQGGEVPCVLCSWQDSLRWLPLLTECTTLKIFSPFPDKQSLPWNFSLYWIFFFPFRIFEQLATALKNSVCVEIVHCFEYLFHYSGFLSNLRLTWKQSCPEFTVLNIYFLSFRIFEQLALALKTEVALKFFKTGGGRPSPLPPTPRLVRLCLRTSYVWRILVVQTDIFVYLLLCLKAFSVNCKESSRSVRDILILEHYYCRLSVVCQIFLLVWLDFLCILWNLFGS